jgi:hypothetical protein
LRRALISMRGMIEGLRFTVLTEPKGPDPEFGRLLEPFARRWREMTGKKPSAWKGSQAAGRRRPGGDFYVFAAKLWKELGLDITPFRTTVAGHASVSPRPYSSLERRLGKLDGPEVADPERRRSRLAPRVTDQQ